MNTLKKVIVVYRRLGSEVDSTELTSNVELTVAMLIAQGCIIIDIIDL